MKLNLSPFPCSAAGNCAKVDQYIRLDFSRLRPARQPFVLVSSPLTKKINVQVGGFSFLAHGL